MSTKNPFDSSQLGDTSHTLRPSTLNGESRDATMR